MAPPVDRPDKLLVKLNGMLDQAVRVVPRPRENFSAAIRAMLDGRYDASIGSARAVGEGHHGSDRCRGAGARVRIPQAGLCTASLWVSARQVPEAFSFCALPALVLSRPRPLSTGPLPFELKWDGLRARWSAVGSLTAFALFGAVES